MVPGGESQRSRRFICGKEPRLDPLGNRHLIAYPVAVDTPQALGAPRGHVEPSARPCHSTGCVRLGIERVTTGTVADDLYTPGAR